MSGLGCDRTHGRSGSAQIETNKFQSTLPEGSDRRHQQICGASLRRRVERPHHDTSQVVHLLKIPDFLFVTSEDAYLSLENDNVVVQRDKTALAKIPLRSLEQILSFSYKGASPALMGQCAQTGTGLSFYTPRGRYLCSILGENNRNVLLRRSQYRFADDTDSSARFARSFVIGKIFNSRWVLERTKRDHNLRVNVKRLSGQSQALSGYLKQVSGCNDVDAIRGLEGLGRSNGVVR